MNLLNIFYRLRGEDRLFWNCCPACNSDAPELDTCPVCEGDRREPYPPSKATKQKWRSGFRAMLAAAKENG